MYDDLLEVVRLRPGAVVIPSEAGAVQQTGVVVLPGPPVEPLERRFPIVEQDDFAEVGPMIARELLA
jgi:hypothetical protein